MTPPTDRRPVLVLGATGRRVVAQLRAAKVPVRPAGRRTDPPFDWADPSTWDAVLDGVERLYLLLPDDTDLPGGFPDRVVAAGVRRVVLHSDRAVDLMEVTRLQDAELAVRSSGLEWTIVRPSVASGGMNTSPQPQTVITCVLHPGITALDLVGPFEVFTTLIRVQPGFRAVVVGAGTDPVPTDGALSVAADHRFTDVPHPDVVVCPAVGPPRCGR